MDWQGKTVLLTGHTGFKGSWMALCLHRLGARVVGYALAPKETPSLFNLANVAEGMESHIGDINDLATLSALVAKTRPDVVIHMAAQSLVRLSYEQSLLTFRDNVMGTVHCLEALRACSTVRAALIVTSDKCYENREQLSAYQETDPLGGYDPYSASKACAELVTRAYRNAHFCHAHSPHIVSARAGNVIGGGDFASDRLVPDYYRQYFKQETLQIRYPEAVRPWQHVLEPLRGYLLLLEHLLDSPDPIAARGAYNFGPQQADCVSVESLITQLSDLCENPIPVEIEQTEHVHESELLYLNTKKAQTQLAWYPALDLREALEMTHAWYTRYHNGESVRALCEQQITLYNQQVAHKLTK